MASGTSCTPETPTLPSGANEIFSFSCPGPGAGAQLDDAFSLPLAPSAKPGTYDYTMTAVDSAGDTVSGLSTIQIEN
jgi:hypothetical protein